MPDNNEPDRSDILRRLETLEQEKDQLEQRVEQLENDNITLKKQLETHRQTTIDIEKELGNLKDKLTDTIETLELHESRLNSIVDSIETLEQRITDNRIDNEEQRAKLAKRVTYIQNALDIDAENWDEYNLFDEHAPEIERFSYLPADLRADKPNLDRAATIWEHFDRYADYRPKGYVITSKNARRLLNTVNDEDYAYQQIHRAMEEFEKHTPPEFALIETREGKSLIRYNDVTDARAKQQADE